jgi:hypothetical protein
VLNIDRQKNLVLTRRLRRTVAVLLLALASFAHAQDFTPNLNLCKPTGSMSASTWASCNRSAMDNLDFDFAAPLSFNATTKELSCPTCAGGVGTVAVTGGGTGLTTVALGQILYGSAANTYSLLAGNTAAAKRYLTQTGTGSASAAPVWSTPALADFAAQTANLIAAGPASGAAAAPTFRALVDADIPNNITIDLAQQAISLAADPSDCPSGQVAVGINAIGTAECATVTGAGFGTQSANTIFSGPASGADATPTFRVLGDSDIPDSITLTNVTQITNRALSDMTGTVGIAQGAVGFTTYTLGNIIYSDAPNTLARLAPNTAADERFLAMTGTGSGGAAPVWTLLDDANIPNTITLDNITQITARDINDLTGTTLPASVVGSSLTGVGALTTGSIAAGFGAIDNGTNDIEGGTFSPAEDTETVADSGDASPAVATLTPTTSYVSLTCSDTDGCTMTLGEGGAENGDLVTIVNVSANVANFADSAGVSELSAAFAMGQYDTLTLLYATDRWVEVSRSNN